MTRGQPQGCYIDVGLRATPPGPPVRAEDPEIRHTLFLVWFLVPFCILGSATTIATLASGTRHKYAWWAWLFAFSLVSAISFIGAWVQYGHYSGTGGWGKEERLNWNGQKILVPVKPRLELFTLSEHRKPKLLFLLLSPHMALLYSLLHRELGLVPVLRNAKHRTLVRLDRPLSELFKQKPDPPVFFPEQREEIARLQASLAKIGPDQWGLPEVLEARTRLLQLTRAHDELPKIVENHAASILAWQVLSQIDDLAIAPQNFVKTRQEVYDAEITRIKASMHPLNPGEEQE